MNPVVVRNVAIGEGIPKICVPIVGKTREEILDAAKKILPIGADVVEWRVDWYEDIFDFENARFDFVIAENKSVSCTDFVCIFHLRLETAVHMVGFSVDACFS